MQQSCLDSANAVSVSLAATAEDVNVTEIGKATSEMSDNLLWFSMDSPQKAHTKLLLFKGPVSYGNSCNETFRS